jgi:hypothetical protein
MHVKIVTVFYYYFCYRRCLQLSLVCVIHNVDRYWQNRRRCVIMNSEVYCFIMFCSSTDFKKNFTVMDPNLYPSHKFTVWTEKGGLCGNACDLLLKGTCLDLSCHIMYPSWGLVWFLWTRAGKWREQIKVPMTTLFHIHSNILFIVILCNLIWVTDSFVR